MLLSFFRFKIWLCTALGAYSLLVRVLRYRRRDGVPRRLNVREAAPTLMNTGL
jgi:hypothetical protein